jgi:hypothetical protein
MNVLCVEVDFSGTRCQPNSIDLGRQTEDASVLSHGVIRRASDTQEQTIPLARCDCIGLACHVCSGGSK